MSPLCPKTHHSHPYPDVLTFLRLVWLISGLFLNFVNNALGEFKFYLKDIAVYILLQLGFIIQYYIILEKIFSPICLYKWEVGTHCSVRKCLSYAKAQSRELIDSRWS